MTRTSSCTAVSGESLDECSLCDSLRLGKVVDSFATIADSTTQTYFAAGAGFSAFFPFA